MTNKEILQADLLDILFEHRNKAYGAYVLRKDYTRRLQWALCISLALVSGILIVTSNDRRQNSDSFMDDKVVKLSSVAFYNNGPKMPKLPKTRSKLQGAQLTYLNRIKIVDDHSKTQMPDKHEIDASLTSTRTIPGINAPGSSEGLPQSPNGNSVHSEGDGQGQNIPLRHSDAQFPGGKEAFAKFLTKYIVTPDGLEAGEKKVVVVRFMVDVDGSITRMEIVQTDGDEYSREVMRVLSKMPRWIPAEQNGLRVATWFEQSVSFIGIEQ